MVKVTFIEHSGRQHEVEAREGLTLMETAVKNNVPGIDADCGGACACATCHVFVEPDWLGRLAPQSPMETSMLEFADETASNSRLACQISLAPDLDGLTVRLPQSQH
ncbi:MAG: 2Fe-2S iron-sulfur cluster binding domain-containing protein [Phenylobacterium sp.]|nr:2Fe-2S iron-sulfur cluster binding domain-containing protein [Phenylobacterium sp.]